MANRDVGDFNNDGKVDISDLNECLLKWGIKYTIIDLNIILINWGKISNNLFKSSARSIFFNTIKLV